MLGPLQWLETVFHSDDVALGYIVSQKGLTLCIPQLLKLTALPAHLYVLQPMLLPKQRPAVSWTQAVSRTSGLQPCKCWVRV